MKLTLTEGLEILGIQGFQTKTVKQKNGAFREMYAKEHGDIKCLLMSNEFGKDGKGRPDPKKEIWITILDNRDPDKHDYVMQFSNKAPVATEPGQTYGK